MQLLRCGECATGVAEDDWQNWGVRGAGEFQGVSHTAGRVAQALGALRLPLYHVDRRLAAAATLAGRLVA